MELRQPRRHRLRAGRRLRRRAGHDRVAHHGDGHDPSGDPDPGRQGQRPLRSRAGRRPRARRALRRKRPGARRAGAGAGDGGARDRGRWHRPRLHLRQRARARVGWWPARTGGVRRPLACSGRPRACRSAAAGGGARLARALLDVARAGAARARGRVRAGSGRRPARRGPPARRRAWCGTVAFTVWRSSTPRRTGSAWCSPTGSSSFCSAMAT